MSPDSDLMIQIQQDRFESCQNKEPKYYPDQQTNVVFHESPWNK